MISFFRQSNKVYNRRLQYLRFFKKAYAFKYRHSLKKFIFKRINGKFIDNKIIYYVSLFNKKVFYLKHTFLNFGRSSVSRNKLHGLWLFKKNFFKLKGDNTNFFNVVNFLNVEFSSDIFLLLLELSFYSDSFSFYKLISFLLEKEFKIHLRVLDFKKKILQKNLFSKLQTTYLDSEKKFKFLYLVDNYQKRFNLIASKPTLERIKVEPIFQWVFFSKSKKTKSIGFLFYRKLGQCLNKTGKLWSSYRIINRSVFFLKKELRINFDLFELFGFVFSKINPNFSLVKHNIGRQMSLIPKPTLGFQKQISVSVKLFIRALNRRSENSFKEKLTNELKDFILDKTPTSILLKKELIDAARPLRYAVKFFFKRKKR